MLQALVLILEESRNLEDSHISDGHAQVAKEQNDMLVECGSAGSEYQGLDSCSQSYQGDVNRK